jgi:GNAT superfamily N-acetyltransferase
LAPEGLTESSWNRLLWRHPLRQRLPLYYPAAREADYQIIRVCDRTGWDAAVLSWSSCTPCRRGHVFKISIAEHWQGKGLGRTLIRRAMRGAETYRWTTTSQSPEGRRFFAVLAQQTGAGSHRTSRFASTSARPTTTGPSLGSSGCDLPAARRLVRSVGHPDGGFCTVASSR